MLKNISSYNIILGSKSPRRQELLKSLGIDFDVLIKETDESFSDTLTAEEIALSIAEKKSEAYQEELSNNNVLLITADTIVCVEDEIINKPYDKEEAFMMLKKLSGRAHWVYTGVCIRTSTYKNSFVSATKVYFTELSDEEIGHYIQAYSPFDKAGAYGIQEWIGFMGINRIEGSYFNVVGLPTSALYKALKEVPEKQ